MTNLRVPSRAAAGLMLVAQLAYALPASAVAPASAPAPAPAAAAAARPAVSALVRRAQGLYAQARYDEAVTALFGPVSRGELKGTELRDARVVMARCYVKKGLTAKAKELFATIVAGDPAFVLDASRGDAEEIDVFNQVKPPAPAAKPHGPAAPQTAVATPKPKPAPPAEKPKLHKPELGPSPDKGPGWVSRHKVLAAALVVGGGSAAVLLASSGGGADKTNKPAGLPAFPDPPPGH